jgi:hypothetical protein
MTAQAHIPTNGADVLDLHTGGRTHLKPVPIPEHGAKKSRRLGKAVGGAFDAVGSDAANLRLAVARPPSLTDWLEARATDRVPDDWRLRVAWHVDHWTVGLAFVAASVALFTFAATARWMACHPARRWVLIGLTCTYVAWLSQA